MLDLYCFVISIETFKAIALTTDATSRGPFAQLLTINDFMIKLRNYM